MRFLLLLLLALPIGTFGRESYAIRASRLSEYHHPEAIAQRSAGNNIELAKSYLRKVAPEAELVDNGDSYTDAHGIAHVYLTQTVDGVRIENARGNVNLRADGTVISMGDSLIKGEVKVLGRRDEAVSPVEALKAAKEKLGYKYKADAAKAVEESSFQDEQRKVKFENVEGVLGEPTGELLYFAADDGTVKQVWRLETDLDDNYMITYVNAQNPSEILGAIDLVDDATYEVYPLGVNDPDDGGRVVVKDPFQSDVSPDGWHKSGGTSYTSTRGNNGIAQENFSGGSTWESNYRPDGGSDLKFEFPYNRNSTDPRSYIDAAVTQLFYTSNMYHDLLEQLGFDEVSGNFEEVNTGTGGRGGDAVQLNAQDGSGTNNANFLTPVDGQRPRMRMYTWTTAGGPRRDGDFEAGIVIHEYSHGLSNRLTGGPGTSGCLSATESGGMGEGWGDWYATAIRIKEKDTRSTDYGMGNWANGRGIRNYPYSTSLTTNPLTYARVGTSGYTAVHAIGTIWATILYEVMWNLEEKHGYSPNVFPTFRSGTKIPQHGRHLAMKLVLEGMKLHPCNPTFLQARQAIVDADQALTGGENKCELWAGFAKRGLGTDARQNGNTRVDGSAVPVECRSSKFRRDMSVM